MTPFSQPGRLNYRTSCRECSELIWTAQASSQHEESIGYLRSNLVSVKSTGASEKEASSTNHYLQWSPSAAANSQPSHSALPAVYAYTHSIAGHSGTVTLMNTLLKECCNTLDVVNCDNSNDRAAISHRISSATPRLLPIFEHFSYEA